MSKKFQRLKRSLSWSVGVLLVVFGLAVGLSVPQRLDLRVESLSDNTWAFRLNTQPSFSPLGQVSFETSSDGVVWQAQATDGNGWNGWQGQAAIEITAVLHVKAVMVDGLGKRHEVRESFVSRAALAGLIEPSDFGENGGVIAINQVKDPLLNALATADRASRLRIVTLIKAVNDRSFLPYLVEIFRFENGNPEIKATLETLSGTRFGGNRAMRLWYEWLWGQSIPLADDFFAWKRQLFAHEQPALVPMLQAQGSLNWTQVVWGGVAPGGIPTLNDPAVISADEADYLSGEDIVFGAAVNGQARAYPIRIMDWHEMANDTLGGEPVLLSYCPLCGSAFLYSRRFGADVYTFNSSGLLYESNKLMYDDQTFSLWPNLLGKPLSGPLSDSAATLKRFSLTTTTWANWRTTHPDTDVLNPNQGTILTYDGHEAYDLYRVERDALIPVSYYDDRLPPKAWVYGLEVEGQAVAFSMQALPETGVLNDTINPLNVLLVVDPIPGSQYGFYPSTVRAFVRQDQTFTRTEAGIQDQDGVVWIVSEDGLLNSNSGAILPRLNGETAYWFAWSNFHRETQLR